MSILGTKNFKSNKALLKTWIIYLSISVICIVIDRVYALFSFGVYSLAMDYMFLYPLLLGALPYFLLWVFSTIDNNGKLFLISSNAIGTGIAILVVGATLQGIVEIAGRTTVLLKYFPYVGWSFYVFGFIVYLVKLVSVHIKKK